MSSLRRVQSSKATGAPSKGPVTTAGKERSSLNAIRHVLCAKCIVVKGESRDNFPILLQAARRSLIVLQPDGRMMDQIVVAFDTLAASPSLTLLHRYETRLHLMYKRSLRTLAMLRDVKIPNDPNPISEHPPAAPVVPESTAAPPGRERQAADAHLVYASNLHK
jgi:hypothetical protein